MSRTNGFKHSAHFDESWLFFSEQTSDGGLVRHQTRTLRRGGGGCCGRGTLPLPGRICRPPPPPPSSSPAGWIQFPAASSPGTGAQLPTPVERARQQQTDGVIMM